MRKMKAVNALVLALFACSLVTPMQVKAGVGSTDITPLFYIPGFGLYMAGSCAVYALVKDSLRQPNAAIIVAVILAAGGGYLLARMEQK